MPGREEARERSCLGCSCSFEKEKLVLSLKEPKHKIVIQRLFLRIEVTRETADQAHSTLWAPISRRLVMVCRSNYTRDSPAKNKIEIRRFEVICSNDKTSILWSRDLNMGLYNSK